MSMSVSPDVFVAGIRGCVACGAVYRKDFRRCANDGRELEILPEDPLIGREVGAYMVASLLGEGAMGRVYRAHHKHLVQKQYALKVLLGDLEAVQSMRMRFEKEAELASRLSHPNVVSVLDFGRTQAGLLYLAMDLLDGRTLADELAEQPMHPARVVELARQIASGLAHAHELGLIHRDLKPDNVMVVEERGREVARITDFGLAIASEVERDVRLTDTGYVIGTAAYMAPEQAMGKALDARADLYALGVAMFEMLTGGKLPFTGAANVLVTAKAMHEAPSLAEVAPDIEVPSTLAAVVAKLMARKRGDRFQTAEEVIAALDDLDLVPAPVRRDDTVATFDAPPTVSRRPRRGLQVAGTLSTVSVVAVAVGLVQGRAEEPDPEPSAMVAPTPAPTPARVDRPALVGTEPEASRPADEDRVAPSPGAIAHATTRDRPTTDRPKPRIRREASRARVRAPTRARTAEAAPPKPPTAGVITAAAPSPPLLLPQPPPPVAPAIFAPRIANLRVDGSLATVVVRRSLARVSGALGRCTSNSARTFDVQLTIGEARRATGTRGGDGSTAARCVISAISDLRTDIAPDVGDASVRVRVQFVERK